MIEIVLTPEGDTLEHRHDEDGGLNMALSNDLQPIGRHKFCRGLLFFIEISETHRAICCNKCGLRLAIQTPGGIDGWTYRNLVEVFITFNPTLLGPSPAMTTGLSGYLVVPRKLVT